MKKLLMSLALVSFLIACGGGGGEQPKEASAEVAPAAEAKEDITKNPDYQKGLALIAQSDCLTCHKVGEASTGPAYKDVAARYPNAADSTIERLANTIIKGGSGNWGSVPMTPHPAVSIDDAKQMVKYVLLLNN